MTLTRSAHTDQLHITNDAGQVVATLRKTEEWEGRGFVIQRRHGQEYLSPDGQWYAHSSFSAHWPGGRKPPSWPDPIAALDCFQGIFGKVEMR